MQTQRGKGLKEFVEEKLSERAIPRERWPLDELAPVAIKARIDYGRWLADCPYCPNANLIDLEDLRFFCCLCCNERAGRRWLSIVMPPFREELEQLIDDGRAEHALAWRDGMTLEDVAAGAPVHTVELSREQILTTAQEAWDARDELRRRIVDLEAQVIRERDGTHLLIKRVERMRIEANIRKDLNRDLQDQIDALVATHSHEN